MLGSPASYCTAFQSLNVDRNRTRYSMGKAPHKPTLLLALILLAKNRRIDLEHIKPTVHLRETWARLWECLDYDRIGPIYLPLYHLRSDGFWQHRFHPGITDHKPTSLREYQRLVADAAFPADLIDLIDEPGMRTELINALLNGGYYSETEVAALRAAIEALDHSFVYEKQLQELINTTFSMEPTQASQLPTTRDPAFRRTVLASYDEQCAVCGLKLVCASGVSVIDAAHILPFNRFFNDDIRNGLALCKNHHWLFDRGLIGVSPKYRVRVSPTIDLECPEGVVSRFRRRRLLLPAVVEHRPAAAALVWHRETVFQG